MNTFKYQNKKNKNYFEGWYTRFTTKDNLNIAVIFAITKDIKNPHSFIQVFKENDDKCIYLSFKTNDFSFADDKVTIGKNSLSKDQIILDHEDISCNVSFTNQDTLDQNGGHPSAMGFLHKAPLECFQEVIFLEAFAKGSFSLKGKTYEIKSKGYMEKTFGDNFPSRWIWIQSNYNKDNAKISFSIGLIPILFFKVKGFFLLLKINNELLRFSSYNLSRIKVKRVNEGIIIIIKKGKHKIVILPRSIDPVTLVGPRKNGEMTLDVFESIKSTATVQHFIKKELVYEGVFENVGYENMY